MSAIHFPAAGTRFKPASLAGLRAQTIPASGLREKLVAFSERSVPIVVDASNHQLQLTSVNCATHTPDNCANQFTKGINLFS